MDEDGEASKYAIACTTEPAGSATGFARTCGVCQSCRKSFTHSTTSLEPSGWSSLISSDRPPGLSSGLNDSSVRGSAIFSSATTRPAVRCIGRGGSKRGRRDEPGCRGGREVEAELRCVGRQLRGACI